MAEGEEPLGFGDASTVGVAMRKSEVTAGGWLKQLLGVMMWRLD